MGVFEEFRALVDRGLARYEAALHGRRDARQPRFCDRDECAQDLDVEARRRRREPRDDDLRHCGIREDAPYFLGSSTARRGRSAALMVNNDRILGVSAQMLLVHRGESDGVSCTGSGLRATQLLAAGVLLATNSAGCLRKGPRLRRRVRGPRPLRAAAGAGDARRCSGSPRCSRVRHSCGPTTCGRFPISSDRFTASGGNERHAEPVDAPSTRRRLVAVFARRPISCSCRRRAIRCTPIDAPLPPEGRLFDVLGTCFRHEPSDDPRAHGQAFHMHEFVRLSTPDERARVPRRLARAGFATDGRAGPRGRTGRRQRSRSSVAPARMLAANQRTRS